MALSKYLQRYNLAAPIDYEWNRNIASSFQENPADEHPKLYDALHLISLRAAYALGVACSEWAVARLQAHADVSDAVLRIQAAWAANIDYRYADLPKPELPPRTGVPDPIGAPLWMTKQFLTYDYQFLVKTHQGVANKGIRGTALRFALLAQHVAGKASGFDDWLTASLRRAAAIYPAVEVPIDQERPVPRDFFDPDFTWSEEAVAASQARLLSELDPAVNPYLRSPEQMRADGFEGDPYPHLH
jgi:hypothetical protein